MTSKTETKKELPGKQLSKDLYAFGLGTISSASVLFVAVTAGLALTAATLELTQASENNDPTENSLHNAQEMALNKIIIEGIQEWSNRSSDISDPSDEDNLHVLHQEVNETLAQLSLDYLIDYHTLELDRESLNELKLNTSLRQLAMTVAPEGSSALSGRLRSTNAPITNCRNEISSNDENFGNNIESAVKVAACTNNAPINQAGKGSAITLLLLSPLTLVFGAAAAVSGRKKQKLKAKAQAPKAPQP